MTDRKAFPESYADPLYASADQATETKLGLPAGLLSAIRTDGERTNASRISSAGAVTPYQFTPATRKAILKQYGLDVTLSPENASEGAGLLLKEALDRNQGDPEAAVGEYHGGVDRTNWGPINSKYRARVMQAFDGSRMSKMAADFGAWMAKNPAAPAQGVTPAQPGQSTQQPAADDKLSADFGAWLQASKTPEGQPQIPATPAQDAYRQQWQQGQTPEQLQAAGQTTMDKAIGTGEAALSALSGATTGTVGGVLGTLNGMSKAILSGQFGTQQAADLVEQAAAAGQSSGTYQPRTASGQEQAAALGDLMQQALPALAVAPTMPAGMPPARSPAGVTARAGLEGAARDAADFVAKPAEAVGIARPGAAGEAAAGAVSRGADAAAAAGQRIAQAAKAATTLPRRAVEAVTGRGAKTEPMPTPGTLGSAGAAGTDMALQRTATAEQLGFTGDAALTKGQATRDPAQLKFEVETAKNPELGQGLRERANNQNAVILGNFDHWIDQTGSEAPTLRATGQAVDRALVQASERDKAQVNALYRAARKTPEAEAPVDHAMPVQLGGGDGAIVSTPIDWINQQPSGLSNTKLLDAARQYAVKLGIADMQDGQLVPRQLATVKQMEDWRQAIGQSTDYEPTSIRQATIIKALIDGQTEPVIGPAYRQARQARARYAQNYEDRAVISKLLNNKRGTGDRAVALEDVFNHTVLQGSLDDLRNVRRVLHRSGPEGAQAWRELQGATVRWIQEQATRTVATDARGNAVISAAGLDKAIRTLDADGKLDFVFGKRGAQQMRDIRDLAQYVKTVPPEAAVNTSNTASALLTAFADLGISGATGLPAPVATVGKAVLKYIKDKDLRARIADALNNNRPAAQTAPAAP